MRVCSYCKSGTHFQHNLPPQNSLLMLKEQVKAGILIVEKEQK